MRGGKRPNSGRKSTVVKEKVSFKLAPEVIKIIKSQENQAVFLENAVMNYDNPDPGT